MKAADSSPELRRDVALRPLSDADFREMVETVADYAIFMLDVNGAVRSWNAGAKRIKGYNFEEVEGRHFSMFYPQELIDRHWPQHELAMAQEKGRFEDEGWRVRKDGSRFWANIIITRMLTPSGELRGFSKITRDLTDRRNQEEQLRLSEERFRLLLESVKDYAIFMLDRAGHIVSWNLGAEKNKGYKAAEIIGQHFSVFYPEEQKLAGIPAQELAIALRDGQFLDEGWRIRKDGTRFWAHVVLTSVHDESGRHRGFAKVTRDLTDSRKIGALVDESRRITSYLATLGHELRNPLAPIANALALMNQVPIESPTLLAARNVIDRQMKQMTRLVDDLLDVSRVANGKIRLEKKPVAIADVIEQAIEAAQPLMTEKSQFLYVHETCPEAWVSGDRVRLIQIVTNLLNNAAKFTPNGGRIEIDGIITGGFVEIRVRDNGRGIDEALRQQIFHLFVQGEQTLSREQSGLGIGLALARQLAQLQGGAIDVFSTGKPGEGSEFVVTLPLAPMPVKLAKGHAKKLILVVDDNRDAAEMMELLIKGLGYDCISAFDGLSAFEMTKEHSPNLVILDIGLPGMNGLEVAQRIRAEVTNPPDLIALSGYNQDSDREASFKAGFQMHLSKPVDFSALTTALKRMFD